MILARYKVERRSFKNFNSDTIARAAKYTIWVMRNPSTINTQRAATALPRDPTFEALEPYIRV
jgi:hypothetical protein